MSMKYDDGFSTTLLFGNIPGLDIQEKEVTPPGVNAGGPIAIATMRSSDWRTDSPKQLKTPTPVTTTVTFSYSVLQDILEQIGVNQLITVTFPDSAGVVFWGWIEEFLPNAFTEGEQPTATITIQPSYQDPDGNEVDPIFVTIAWIVETGFWDDLGRWKDDEFWIDEL